MAPRRIGRLSAARAFAEFLAPAAQPFERLVVAITRHALVAADTVAPVEFAVDPLISIGRAVLLQRVGDGFDRAGQLGGLLLVDRLLRIEPELERSNALVGGGSVPRLICSCAVGCGREECPLVRDQGAFFFRKRLATARPPNDRWCRPVLSPSRPCYRAR